MNTNRRTFLKNAAINMTGLAAVPAILSASMPFSEMNKKRPFSILKENDVILFQGDSITDSSRKKDVKIANNSNAFGSGYALIAASEMLNALSDRNLTIYNRGISGDKVYQLAARWQEDCIALKPSVLSILIGVNDFWAIEKHGYDGTLKKYEDDFRNLLKLTLQELPGANLIIGEPFAVAGGSAINDKWFPAFTDYQLVAQKIASEFNAIFIPYQTIFNKALKYAPATYWTPDGVHPSMAGCSLMAQAWLKSIR